MTAPRDRIADARLYLCAPASDRAFLEAVGSAGVDVIQLRDRSLDDDGIVRAAREFRAAADATGALFILNDRADLVEACGADGVHVGQGDATPAEARRLIGRERVIGRSTHAPEQGAEAVADADVDYLSIGPVHPTPTKPGRPATGLGYVRWAAEQATAKPWFAIGGIDHDTVDDVVAAGATRIVVVRAITEANDPPGAAAGLREALEGVRGRA